MAEKNFIFSFVTQGLDGLINGLGKATDKAKDAAKEIKNLKTSFSKIYANQREEGVSAFKAVGVAMDQTITQAGGLLKALQLITRVGAGGILLFLSSKAFQNNLGGIADAFARVSAAFGELWGRLNVAINEFMSAIGPQLEGIIKTLTDILVFLINIVTDLLDAFNKAPKIIQVLVGSIITLGVALWALGSNPVFIVLAGAVVAVWLLYKGFKALVDLFTANSEMNMNMNVNYNGIKMPLTTDGIGGNMTNNSVNNIQNNVYLTGSDSAVGDAKTIANELSYLSSIAKME